MTSGPAFLGAHLSKALLARGDEVITVDNFATSNRDTVGQMTLGLNGPRFIFRISVRSVGGLVASVLRHPPSCRYSRLDPDGFSSRGPDADNCQAT
jgi:hypothetical protein